jgi:hypothetical protein
MKTTGQKGVSRRNIIRGIAVAGIAGTGAKLSAQPIPENDCDTGGETAGLFKQVIYMWLVISTNKAFTTGTIDYAEIIKDTGLTQTLVDKAIKIITPANLQVIQKAFGDVAHTALNYPPGDCPAALCTLRGVKYLKP